MVAFTIYYTIIPSHISKIKHIPTKKNRDEVKCETLNMTLGYHETRPLDCGFFLLLMQKHKTTYNSFDLPLFQLDATKEISVASRLFIHTLKGKGSP